MSSPSERTIVTVTIAGEDYSIRAQASPDYTRECAAEVDRALSEIMKQGSLIQAHKGAILAALALADELLQTRRALQELRGELTTRADGMVSQIDERLARSDLAGPS